MGKAVDTTVTLAAGEISGLLAAGVSAVSRYVCPAGESKRILPAEYQRLMTAGMQVILNWENRANDLLTLGAADTLWYAQQAVSQAQSLGYPRGCVIYNSADWDVTAAQWPAVAANLRIVKDQYAAAGFGLGLYSSYDALSWAKRDGLVVGYWQSMSASFSGGRNGTTWPGAHLRQHLGTTIAGVPVDPSDILISNFGQAGGNTMALTDPIPNTGTPDAHPQNRTEGEALHDLWEALTGTGWQGEQLTDIRQILAAVKAAPATGGLLPADQMQAITDLTAAVTKLSGQLERAGAAVN